MNSSNSRTEHGRPYSDDDITIVVEGPGDATVRPIPPERRARAIAELEKIRQWERIDREGPAADRKPS